MSEPPLQALFFDTFGTVVQWRSSVSKALADATAKALGDPSKNLSADLRQRAESLTTSDWQQFTAEWRKTYAIFTYTFDASSQEFISVDQHHYNSLGLLLEKRGIKELFDDKELWDLAFSWHRLDPWADSVEGLAQLNTKFRTSTLSNGNVSLLEDLAKFASLQFTRLTSAEEFGAYKPSPKVYTGAAGIFNLQPTQCAMVAAHLFDLKAAKALGFYTIYVEREQEEAFTTEQIEQAKKDGFVDIWVGINDGGFLEVARRLGINTEA